MIELAPLDVLIRVSLISLGVAYVVTGSEIGYWVRALWFLFLFRVPLVRHLIKLALCPSCCAWWVGLVTAFLSGFPLWVALQCAFVSCGLAAVAQGVAGLAAEDEDDIGEMWVKFINRLRGKRE